MDASNPARQMALIGKARLCGNLGKADFSIPNHFDRPSQSQMNDVAMRADADGPGEGAGKMELAAVRHSRERRDVKRSSRCSKTNSVVMSPFGRLSRIC